MTAGGRGEAAVAAGVGRRPTSAVAIDAGALTDFLLARPEAAGEGTRFLARDLPVKEGIRVDLLGVDRRGRWILVLCGEADGTLLLHTVDAVRAFRSARSLIERLLAESPRRGADPPRVFLVVHRATPEFLDQLAFLGGLESEVYEFRSLGRGSRSAVNFCRVSLAGTGEAAAAPAPATLAPATPAPRHSPPPAPSSNGRDRESPVPAGEGDALEHLRAAIEQLGPEARCQLEEDRLEVFLEGESYLTLVRDEERFFLRCGAEGEEEEVPLDEAGRARLLDRIVAEDVRRVEPAAAEGDAPAPQGDAPGPQGEAPAPEGADPAPEGEDPPPAGTPERVALAALTKEELQALGEPARGRTSRTARRGGHRASGSRRASRKGEGREVEGEPSRVGGSRN